LFEPSELARLPVKAGLSVTALSSPSSQRNLRWLATLDHTVARREHEDLIERRRRLAACASWGDTGPRGTAAALTTRTSCGRS
jgi:hypothetical protein